MNTWVTSTHQKAASSLWYHELQIRERDGIRDRKIAWHRHAAQLKRLHSRVQQPHETNQCTRVICSIKWNQPGANMSGVHFNKDKWKLYKYLKLNRARRIFSHILASTSITFSNLIFVWINSIHTVCPRSGDLFYIVSYNLKWFTWTYSIMHTYTGNTSLCIQNSAINYV